MARSGTNPRPRCSKTSAPPARQCRKRPENLLSGEGRLGSSSSMRPPVASGEGVQGGGYGCASPAAPSRLKSLSDSPGVACGVSPFLVRQGACLGCDATARRCSPEGDGRHFVGYRIPRHLLIVAPRLPVPFSFIQRLCFSDRQLCDSFVTAVGSKR